MHTANINSETLAIIKEAARTQAARQIGLFGGLADLSKRDLVQHLVTIAISELVLKYDPARGASLKTYLNNCMYRRLIDLWRSKDADARRSHDKGIHTALQNSCNNSDSICNYLTVDSDCGLEVLGQRAMAAAVKAVPRFSTRGQRKFTQHQLLATALVMASMRASVEGVLYLIGSSSGLRHALQYTDELPTHQRVYQFILRFEKNTGYRFTRQARRNHAKAIAAPGAT